MGDLKRYLLRETRICAYTHVSQGGGGGPSVGSSFGGNDGFEGANAWPGRPNTSARKRLMTRRLNVPNTNTRNQLKEIDGTIH